HLQRGGHPRGQRACRGGGLMPLLQQMMRLVWKDVVVELRRKELVYASAFFAGVVLLVFSFAFLGGERHTQDVAAGVLWVTVAMTWTLGIGRAFEREREGDTFRALLLAPIPRSAIYLGKLVSLCLLMVVAEAVALFGVALLFGAPIFDHPAHVALLLGLGTVGFAAVASLFAASLGRSRSPAPLLPRALAAAAAHGVSIGGADVHRRSARDRGPPHWRGSRAAGVLDALP